jgi:hypothetical protein
MGPFAARPRVDQRLNRSLVVKQCADFGQIETGAFEQANAHQACQRRLAKESIAAFRMPVGGE